MMTPAVIEVKTDHVAEPLAGAQTAAVDLAALRGPGTIRALPAGVNLFEAEVRHLGALVEYKVEGEPHRVIALTTRDWPDNLSALDYDRSLIGWDVGLSPDVPLALTIRSCSGGGDFDLDGLALSELTLESLSAGLKLALPAVSAPYPVRLGSISGSLRMTLLGPGGVIDLEAQSLSGGMGLVVGKETSLRAVLQQVSGSLDVTLAQDSTTNLAIKHLSGGLRITAEPGAALALTLANASGGAEITVPEGAAVRVEAQSVTGHVSITLPTGKHIIS
ncbi:MAG: hypothetical protein JW910_00120, partial [Anaerolineae bacterium]|nr:hypothetical protein [Anaerolineae bacterium]